MQLPVAWCDSSNLRLPQSLAVYPEVSLNQDLYRWLALIAAQAGQMRHWARDNQRWTQALLEQFPAMRPRYQRLVEAHLQLRPDPKQLPKAEAALEAALCQALREPGSVSQFPRSERAPWPLPLWLYPAENLGEPQAAIGPRRARAIWKPRLAASPGSASVPGALTIAPARAGCCCSAWRTCSAGQSMSNWTAAMTIPKTSTRPV
jgi:nitric oxide reductase activation protein